MTNKSLSPAAQAVLDTALEMTKYEIEDVSEAANVVREADHYHQQMLDILHSENAN